MSWLYDLSIKKGDFGKITKREGEIKMFYRKTYVTGFDDYEDYWFVDKEGDRIVLLDTWRKPKSGVVKNRCVYLEEEDDEKAIAILTENIEEDIRKLKLRSKNLSRLIKRLEIIEEAKDE